MTYSADLKFLTKKECRPPGLSDLPVPACADRLPSGQGPARFVYSQLNSTPMLGPLAAITKQFLCGHHYHRPSFGRRLASYLFAFVLLIALTLFTDTHTSNLICMIPQEC